MRLSKLQKHILNKCYNSKLETISKLEFYSFYSVKARKNRSKDIHDIIHKSLENLTKKDLIVAYGRKTAKKWYINKVKLTARGRSVTKELIRSKQQKLPIK